METAEYSIKWPIVWKRLPEPLEPDFPFLDQEESDDFDFQEEEESPFQDDQAEGRVLSVDILYIRNKRISEYFLLIENRKSLAVKPNYNLDDCNKDWSLYEKASFILKFGL